MRIDPVRGSLVRSVSPASQSGEQAVSGKAFSDFLQQQERGRRDPELAEALEEIRQQSDRLARSMTMRELHAYKRLVKRYLERTARKGVGLKDARSRDRQGRDRQYLLLDEIDRELLSLADELLETEQGRMALLTTVGEIKGLLFHSLS
ncbi:YaaR family protein [Gorillibacterium sp. sgz500922]|uniref:YaaR family protein n=1 Tax=Gorillibacterium sp. sgz500922 TaxID=3446694 RepID=UPI003F667167